ncbi:MAG: L-2-hydroxyglutarate oxidase, partial [Planctomycetales bacterium]|nr:L-2-hydroxyglutarate oxidase [Planctomycetales bacterium]
MHFDFLIVGGGLVGLGTAWQLSQRFSDATICLIEKESRVAAHQSGRNSGVLHSGIYYKPGSLKAVTCRAGKLLMEEFCQQEEIAYENCGKIIVATEELELPRLQSIYERGLQNQVRCTLIDAQEIVELEPHAAGLKGIHVPDAGIVDYPAVCRKIMEKLQSVGHKVQLNTEIRSIEVNSESVIVNSSNESFQASFLITCGGLHSDRLVAMSGQQPPARIVPFRGEYYELLPDAHHLVRNLIYPVPDPSFPFLGVHFTRMVNGEVECGPNAVLALSREGYTWGTLRVSDLVESLTYSGFQQLALKHWRMGLGEIQRSLSKAAFVKALQR